MHFSIILLTAVLFSCSITHPYGKRSPAQSELSDQSASRLEQWHPIKERLIDRWIHKDVGLYVNSEHPVAYDLIKEAKKTIDIEIYEMKDPLFRSLLLDALDRKVRVRIVKDSNSVGDVCNELEPVSESDEKSCVEEKAFISLIKSKNAEYIFFNKKQLCGIPGRSCFEHGKMIIVDSQYLLLSTGNFNSSSFCNLSAGVDTCNRDYSYVTKNKDVIETLQTVWLQDFSATRWNFKEILAQGNLGLTTSPESRTRLVALLKSATKSLWIQNQYLEDPIINDMIMEKAKEGVEVHVQVAAFCTFGEPSDQKKEKINKIFTDFDTAGVKTKIFASKIKINDKKGYLHAKAIIVDENTGWIGSINGSETSTTQNREFGVIFSHKNSVRKLMEVMSDDFSHPLALSWRDSLNCSK